MMAESLAGPAGRHPPPQEPMTFGHIPGGGGQAGLLGVPQGLSILRASSFPSAVVPSRETKLLTPIDREANGSFMQLV